MKVSEYRKTTDVYTYYNPNPREDERKAWDTGDCVVRAFAVAADITWIEAFDKLAEVARREFRMINSKDCYKILFDELGYKYTGCKPVFGEKRMTLAEFCKKHKKGAYIVDISNHATAVVNGTCFDTWNCTKKCVCCYWEVRRK